MARDARPALSIVIPTYNGRELLGACLTSIEWCAPKGVLIEVIVVDDASTDGTAEWLRAEFPWVRGVRLDRNVGFCGAANAGIAEARAPVIQLLNNDAEVTSGWVRHGLAPFADPRVGSVAPLVVERDEPGRVDSAGDGYHWFGMPYKRGRGESAEKWRRRPPGEVFGASASSAFYRASALKALGGFDPEFGSYYEDVDLAFRLRRDGFRCVYVPECVILHRVSATYDHSNHELQARMARNAELIFWRRVPLARRMVWMLPHVGLVGAQLVHRCLAGRAGAFLRGKRDALARLLRGRAEIGRTPVRGPHGVRARAGDRAPR